MTKMDTELSLLRDIVRELASTMRKQDFLTYLKKISILECNETSIVFGVVSSFMRDNLSHKFSAEVQTAVSKVAPDIVSIDFRVDSNIDNPSNAHVIDCPAEYKEFTSKKKKEEVPGVEVIEGINGRIINSKYKLSNFIVGPSNQLAHAASEAVVRRPGSAYNPLYVYGDVGLGKTHILQ